MMTKIVPDKNVKYDILLFLNGEDNDAVDHLFVENNTQLQPPFLIKQPPSLDVSELKCYVSIV